MDKNIILVLCVVSLTRQHMFITQNMDICIMWILPVPLLNEQFQKYRLRKLEVKHHVTIVIKS